MKTAVAGCLILALCACTPANQVQQSKIEPAAVQCQHVQPTGSVLPKRVCTTAAERQRSANQAQTDMDAMARRQRDEEHRRQMRGR